MALRTDESEDLYYEEYVQRRNAELEARRGRGEYPKTKTPTPPSAKEKTKPKNEQRRTENYGYIPEGYVQKDTYIGEDPLSSLRTMKANLRRRQIDATRQGFEVKAQLCQSACEELAKAEVKLVELHSLRSQAIFNGDLSEAARIAAKMREVKNSAQHGGYADLLMDANQLGAFGVESKWTPEVREDEEERERAVPAEGTKEKEKEKEEDVPIREVRSFSARRRERDGVEPKKEKERPKARKESSKERPPPSAKSNRPKSVERAPTPKKEVKRNQRLKDREEEPKLRKEIPKNDPFGLPVDYGKCKFCDEEGPELGRENLLKLHYAERCPVVHRCTYCDRAIEVSQLTDHQLHRCDFAKDALVMCALCGLAKDRHDDDHPLCRKQFPPRGSSWCPLCSVAVKDWKKHLQNDCYNNPRKGFSGVPLPDSGGAPNFMESVDKLTQSVAVFAKGSSARRGQNGTPSRHPSSLPSGRRSVAPRRQPSPTPRPRPPSSSRAPPPRSESPLERSETPLGVATPQPPQQKYNPITPEQIREAYRKVKEQEEKEKNEKKEKET